MCLDTYCFTTVMPVELCSDIVEYIYITQICVLAAVMCFAYVFTHLI